MAVETAVLQSHLPPHKPHFSRTHVHTEAARARGYYNFVTLRQVECMGTVNNKASRVYTFCISLTPKTCKVND